MAKILNPAIDLEDTDSVFQQLDRTFTVLDSVKDEHGTGTK